MGVEVMVDLLLRFLRDVFHLENAFSNLVGSTGRILYFDCHWTVSDLPVEKRFVQCSLGGKKRSSTRIYYSHTWYSEVSIMNSLTCLHEWNSVNLENWEEQFKARVNYLAAWRNGRHTAIIVESLCDSVPKLLCLGKGFLWFSVTIGVELVLNWQQENKIV